jgi:hypothetical protein
MLRSFASKSLAIATSLGVLISTSSSLSARSGNIFGQEPVRNHQYLISSFSNLLPERLETELKSAQQLGVKPLQVGQSGFDAVINLGTVKWAVTEDNKLFVVPSVFKTVEIYHSVLSGGKPVLAAGGADIFQDGKGGYLLGSINNKTGHFKASVESIQIGIDAFKKAKVSTDKVKIEKFVPGRYY